MTGAHGTPIAVGATTWHVRRELGTLRAVEERFGPLSPLIDRLEAYNVTAVEIVDLYACLLKGEADRPSPTLIAEHVVEAGVVQAVRAPHAFLMAAWLGDAGWQAMTEAAAQRLKGGEEKADPLSRGATSSRSGTRSGGRRKRSGAPLGGS
jgi:hypothetical protein